MSSHSKSTLFFKKYTLLIMLLQLSHVPPSLPSALYTPSHPHSPLFSSCPWVIHIKFFDFYISYTILTLPLYFLSSIYATYSLYLFPLSPPSTPLLITLHLISISVVLFLFQLFAQFGFVFVLAVVVNNCEFAVILLFIFFIFFFLDKSL